MAAPKYNLYALGNSGGKPPTFETPEDLEKKVMAYFDFCVSEKSECSISGLHQFLGFNDRDALLYYEKKQEFSGIVKRARQAVEMSYELDLRTFKFGGAIFALKNINKDSWKDKTESEVKQTVTNVRANFGNTLQPTPKSGEDS
jgi:hypothetical protein